MFKLLKRKVQVAFKSQQDIIQEIHNEFDGASERLLREAYQIINRTSFSDKAERLEKLGFRQAKCVTDNAKKQKALVENEKLAKLIERYSVSYPNNKFITEKSVKAICEKYGLVFGSISDYIGDVPEKNISEIEQFQLKDEDKIRHSCHYYEPHYTPHRTFFSRTNSGAMRYGYVVHHGLGAETFIGTPETTKEVYTSPSMLICAPQKDFNMTRKKVSENGYSLVQDDPIVLQPVEGGYLVVSKWGLESSDEIVVNQQMN